MGFRVEYLSVGQSGTGDDRVAVFARPDRVIIGVADGAGGTGRGGEAADVVLTRLRECSQLPTIDATALLRSCDLELLRCGRGGETTAVVAVIDESGINGASVGDSGAWLVEQTTHTDLTRHQIRKPLLGTGEAVPVAFATLHADSTLLVATDGLLKYTNAARVRQILASNDFDQAPQRLIDSVRLRSGALQDDTTVVLCRRA